MARRCIECGKIITGSVVEHYRNNHFTTYNKNGEDKIKRFPNAFAPDTNSVAGQEIRSKTVKRKVEKKISEINHAQQRDPQYRAIVRAITVLSQDTDNVQTYREGKTFYCDVCKKTSTSGKRILSYLQKYTICYDCYKTIKQANPQKRGNKHVFINTPM